MQFEWEGVFYVCIHTEHVYRLSPLEHHSSRFIHLGYSVGGGVSSEGVSGSPV